MSRPECTPSLETIQEAWLCLRPLLHNLMVHPTPAQVKEAFEEMIKFDTIMRGDLQNVIALFRDTVQSEKKAHEDTKRQLAQLANNLNKARRVLPESPNLTNYDEPPSPIPWDGASCPEC
jgi:hypothetical protein